MPKGIYERKSIEERFWSKVEKGPGCWEWTACKLKKGYGRIKQNGVKYSAHRISWEMKNGKIPKGLQIDHLCRNTSCVNPDHLEPVTQKENILRGVGITAVNAKKTECPKGHKFTDANTYITPPGHRSSGSRSCRKCRSEVGRKYYAKNKREGLCKNS